MTETKLDRAVIFFLRVFVGWLFLYSGSWQILENYSAGGFLNHVVTFHVSSPCLRRRRCCP